MGQGPLLKQPPSVDQGGVYPVGDAIDELIHKLGVASGIGTQRPGDFGDAATAMVPMLPVAKLLGLMKFGKIASEADQAIKPAVNLGDQMLRNHLDLPPEFSPDVKLPGYDGLPQEEVAKAHKLTAQPKRRDPGGQ